MDLYPLASRCSMISDRRGQRLPPGSSRMCLPGQHSVRMNSEDILARQKPQRRAI